MAAKEKSLRGFASMTAEKRQEIASKGGKKAHELGLAHRFSHEEAVRAGKLGGAISRRRSKIGIDSVEKAVKKQGKA